jgi:hypothetical protein
MCFHGYKQSSHLISISGARCLNLSLQYYCTVYFETISLISHNIIDRLKSDWFLKLHIKSYTSISNSYLNLIVQYFPSLVDGTQTQHLPEQSKEIRWSCRSWENVWLVGNANGDDIIIQSTAPVDLTSHVDLSYLPFNNPTTKQTH